MENIGWQHCVLFVAKLCTSLLQNTNMERAYEELKQIVLEIDQGAGILLLYDMGSLRSMIDNISLETNIKVKSIEIPLTLIALESSRKATNTLSLDSLFADISEAYQKMFIL